MKKIFTCLLLLACFNQIQAQCTNAPNGQFPATNFIPNCVGSPETITNFATTLNYSMVTVTSAKSYIFTTSVATDFITITNDAGNTVLGFGTGSVTYNATFSGNVRFYTHLNSACGTNALSRTRYVQCGAVPTQVPNCAVNLAPSNGATNIDINPGPIANWIPIPSPNGGASQYKIYIGTSIAGATLEYITSQTSIQFIDLAPSTTYYWYVVPSNSVGDAQGCSANATSFTTKAAPSLNCGTAVSISNCGVSQTASFAAVAGIYDPVSSSCGSATPGEEKLYTFTPTVTGNYAINVTATTGGFVNYFYKDATAGNCSNFGWSCIGSIGTTGATSMGTLTGGTTYYILLDKEQVTAGSHTFSITCPPPPPVNNDAPAAVNLTLGAGCSGAPYTNVGAFQSALEPVPNCGMGGFATVWYKFTAPASGAVKISTDLGSGNTNFDTRIALYSTTDVNDYSLFNLISCDDDGGSAIGFGFLSVLYATDLTPGNVYYVQVGNNDNSGEGTFCLAIDEMNSTMLAATNTCSSSFQTPVGSNTAYKGWVNLLDANSKLVALVKNSAGGAVDDYSFAQNIRTGTSRQSVEIGNYYLNRNFSIQNPMVGNASVQFFYLNSELTQLQAQAPAATVANMGFAKQTENTPGCYTDLVGANGPITSILQTASGTVNNVHWVTSNVTGFSNFYLYDYGAIVPLRLIAFNGVKQTEQKNYLYWRLSCVGSDNNSIVVERSADAQTFTTIHTLQNLNAEQCSRALDYTDLSPANGINFYRLKFVDADGRINYSPIISLVNGSRAFDVAGISPNPVKDAANLKVYSNNAAKAELFIYSATGTLVSKTKINLLEGENSLMVNVAQLPAGVYHMVIGQPKAEKQTIKFIKQ